VRLQLNEFQQYCLKQHIAFVSYSLPGKHMPITLFSDALDVKVFNRISDIDLQSGFLLSPFQSEKLPVIVISDKNKVEGWEIQLNELPQSGKNSETEISAVFQNPSTFQQYSKQIDEIKKSIYSGEAKKVVLSRIKVLEYMKGLPLPDIFEELVNVYEHAFVYLFYTPYSGIWLGATPESLIEINSTDFSTMALASTKKFSGTISNITWTEKEIKEHAYVADYVRQKLTIGGYSYKESERETVRAGNVVHLRTMFNGTVDNDITAWKKLVDLLYPTPAICGTENESTLQLIHRLEKHRREYYTGIIGPFNELNKTNLFINLRCMKVIDGSALLFAGGGILSESSARKEWDETEMKFNTLIQIIQKVKEKKKLVDELTR